MKFKTQMTHAEVRAKSWHGNDINKTLTEIILFPFQRLTFTNTWSAQAGIFKVQLKMFWDPEERYAVEMYFKWTSFSALKIILRKLLNWHKAIHQTLQNIFSHFSLNAKHPWPVTIYAYIWRYMSSKCLRKKIPVLFDNLLKAGRAPSKLGSCLFWNHSNFSEIFARSRYRHTTNWLGSGTDLRISLIMGYFRVW